MMVPFDSGLVVFISLYILPPTLNMVDVCTSSVLQKLWSARGTWVRQSAERVTFDFGSGHGLGMVRLIPAWDSVLSEESGDFSPPSVDPPACAHTHSLFKKKKK